MKTSTIKLSFYDNISRYLKKYASEIVSTEEKRNKLVVNHKNHETEIGNFYEFYIDGQKLINLIGEKYWNQKNTEDFFDHKMGWIGLFSPYTDFLQANHLLLRSPSLQTIQNFFKKDSSLDKISEQGIQWIKEDFESLSDTSQPKAVQIYGCTCGDEMCGGLEVQISKNDKFYFWDFGDDKLKLQFEKEQYERTFEPFLSL